MKVIKINMKKYSYRETAKRIRKIVEEESKKPANIFGYGFLTYHIMSVVKYAKLLAKKFGADKEIVELVALLHDIGVIKSDKTNHHISGAEDAEKILKKLNYLKEKIEKEIEDYGKKNDLNFKIYFHHRKTLA